MLTVFNELIFLIQVVALFNKAENAKQNADSFHRNGTGIENEIGKILQEVAELIRQLNAYRLKTNTSLSRVNVTEWVQRASQLLAEMEARTNNLTKHLNRAEVEKDGAKKQHKEVIDRTLNETRFSELRNTMQMLLEKAIELQTKAFDGVRTDVDSAKALSEINRRTLDQLIANVGVLNRQIELSEENIENGAKNQSATVKATADVEDIVKTINETLLGDIDTISTEVEMRANQYQNLLPQYENDFVRKAQQHAYELEREARRLQSGFQPTKNAAGFAVDASAAYENIVKALENSTKSAQAAVTAGESAFRIADGELSEQTKSSVSRSRELQITAAQLDMSDLPAKLRRHKGELETIQRHFQQQEKRSNEIQTGFTDFDTKQKEIKRVTGDVDKKLKEIKDVNAAVVLTHQRANNLQQEVEKLKSFAGDEIKNVTSEIDATSKAVTDSRNRLAEVNQQFQQNELRAEDLSSKIAELKEKIKEARTKASLVKLAVHTRQQETCVRTYEVALEPTPTNFIRIRYRPNPWVQDALIVAVLNDKIRVNFFCHISPLLFCLSDT